MKTDTSKPWIGLPIQIPRQAAAMFSMAVEVTIGNGEDALFWTDKWLQGKSVSELAPNLFRAIPNRLTKRRTVRQAIVNRGWIEDIKGALTVQVLSDYLHIWDLVEGTVLQPRTQYRHVWKLSSTGCYSSKSAYNAMFVGSIKFSPSKRIWKTWAPANCKFFIWLAVNNRCWTSDRLAKRGMPHQPACPLCDQAPETINHLLASCVFVREVWALVLQRLNQIILPPAPGSRLNS